MSGFGICENPDILRVISFIKILINVVKFLVPMGLIIMVSLDIGKGVISGENFEKILKASGNKILAAMMIFLLPTIVNFTLVLVDETTSYESCWANANSTVIEEYQVLWDEAKRKEEEEKKKQEFITSSSDITFSYEYVENSNYLPYALYTPSTAQTNETTPLIVWLHGSGERGVTKEVFKTRGLLKDLSNWKLHGFNAYVLCPQNKGSWNNQEAMSKVFGLIDEFIKTKKINNNKIILSGHSMGGLGSLYMAYFGHEKYFSAVAVLSGYNPGKDIDISKISIPVRGYVGTISGEEDSVSVYYMNGDFANAFGKNNLFVFETWHGNVPHVAFTQDKNNDEKSDLIEWMLTQEKR